MRAGAVSLLLRAGRLAGLLLLFCATAALAAFGAGKAKDFLYGSPTFAIEAIRFEGLAHASREELVRLSGLGLGENLFEADLLAAEAGMARNPWVRRISVERSYPRAVTVRVIEYQPAALADMGGLYFVDPSGKAFKKLAAGEEADLPILVGLTREEYAAFEEEVEGLFREALAALEAWRAAGLEARRAVSQVLIDRLAGLTLICGEEAVAVKVGTGHYAEKFARLDRLLGELDRRGARAEVIRLDNRTRPGWVAVRLDREWEGNEQ